MSTGTHPFYTVPIGRGNTLVFPEKCQVSRVGAYNVRKGVGVYFPMSKNGLGHDVCFCAHITAEGYDLAPDSNGELRPTGRLTEGSGKHLQKRIVRRLIRHAQRRQWHPRRVLLNNVQVVCPSLRHSIQGVASISLNETDKSISSDSKGLRLTAWYIEQAIDEFLSVNSGSRVTLVTDKDSDAFVADVRSNEVSTFEYDSDVDESDATLLIRAGLDPKYEHRFYTEPYHDEWTFYPQDLRDDVLPLHQPVLTYRRECPTDEDRIRKMVSDNKTDDERDQGRIQEITSDDERDEDRIQEVTSDAAHDELYE